MPGNTTVDENEQEKMDRYQDTGKEIERQVKVEARVILLVTGALVTMPRGLVESLRTLGILPFMVHKRCS